MNDALHCPKCGSQKMALQPVAANEVAPSANGDEDLLILLEGEVQCLNCGHVWNPAQLIQQDLDNQAQSDALDFAQRKESFYSEMEMGHLSRAKRIVPKEVRFMVKSLGLPSYLPYLKSLDRELYKFKRTYWLVGTAVVLLVVGGLVYSCG